MIDIEARVMYLDENKEWQTIYYLNKELTMQRLKNCRKDKRLSIDELSDALRINADCLRDLETGESLLCNRWLPMIADFYGKSVEYFTCEEEEKNVQLSFF